jgi:hypothetical protein
MTDLLIHVDPGARSGFIAAWLQDNLANAGFDVGATVDTPFLKIHTLKSSEQITNFQGTTIRIKSTFDLLNLQLLLFLRKNVYTQIPDFTRDEFSLDTFSKVYIFAQEICADENLVNYSLYDYAITFKDTFNIDILTELYYRCNNRYPSNEHINLAIQQNKMNLISLDPNHACSIAAMVLETEFKMNLLEKNRKWSLPITYSTSAQENRWQVIKSKIVPENYQNN